MYHDEFGGPTKDLQHIYHFQGQPPPTTYDEWLEYNNIDTWPVDPEEFHNKSLLSPSVTGIGTVQELWNEGKSNLRFQINLLDDVLKEVESLEEKLNKYSAQFFGENPKRNKPEEKGNEKYIQSFIENEISMEDSRKNNQEKSKKRTRNMEFAIFPGFFTSDMTDIPGELEVPRLLNNITKLQCFPVHFKKIWEKYFLSEESVGILQDAFWWIFLESSKTLNKSISKNNDYSISQSRLFDRLANNFASLFLSVPYHIKDSFFKYYPNCLAQALYSAFFISFPLSASNFNFEFRRDLIKLIYEWVTGTYPQEEQVLNHWDLELLENQINRDFSKDSIHLLKKYSFDEALFLKFSSERLNNEISDLLSSPSKSKGSHPVGYGPTFDQVAFNVFGRSPFIKHYLGTESLQMEEDAMNRAVKRTRIKENNDGQKTYSDLVVDHVKQSEDRKKRHDSISRNTTREIQSCNKRSRREIRQMEVEKDLVMKHFDIKVLSQKLMEMMMIPDVNRKAFVSSIIFGNSPDE